MDSRKNALLTQTQFMFLIVGCVLGPGFLKMSGVICAKSKHDSWISVIVGLIYPITIMITGLIIVKKHPNDTILAISKKSFGKVIGTILNIAFLAQYIIINVAMVSDVVRIFSTYLTPFLTPIKIIIVTTSLALFISLKSIKTLAKTNMYISFISFTILSISLLALKRGSLLNFKPIFAQGWSNILHGAIQTSYYYLGFESFLIYHIYVYDKKTIKNAIFYGILFCTALWIWVIFICIYQLGIENILNAAWPLALVLENIQIPVINNFSYIFMFAWTLMSYRGIATFYYTSALILNDVLKIDIKKLCIIIFPIIIYISTKLTNDALKSKVVSVISPILVLFNICFFLVIAAISVIKKTL